jgi:Ni,Fe-hydrogenase I cytochrome b subunit
VLLIMLIQLFDLIVELNYYFHRYHHWMTAAFLVFVIVHVYLIPK